MKIFEIPHESLTNKTQNTMNKQAHELIWEIKLKLWDLEKMTNEKFSDILLTINVELNKIDDEITK